MDHIFRGRGCGENGVDEDVNGRDIFLNWKDLGEKGVVKGRRGGRRGARRTGQTAFDRALNGSSFGG